MNDFSVGSFERTEHFSTAASKDGTKPKLTEKDDFEHRDISLVLALVRIFGLSRFWCKGQNAIFLQRILLHKFEGFDGDFDWVIHTCYLGEICVWRSRQINLDSTFCVLVLSAFDGRIQMHKLSIGFSDASVGFLIDTLVREIKLSVQEKHELDNRNESKLKASSGLFASSIFWCEDPNETFLNQRVHHKLRSSD